jgi:tetratricopeptide (TPR) repeat protein
MGDEALEQLQAEHEILRRDPRKYVEMMTGRIQDDPTDAHAYFRRHNGWASLGRFDDALADLDKSLALREHFSTHFARGELLCRMGRYQEALTNFYRSSELDSEDWYGDWGILERANCHASLGNEAAALADCARLGDDFSHPGYGGLPGGNKAEVTAEIRRRARAAKQNVKG